MYIRNRYNKKGEIISSNTPVLHHKELEELLKEIEDEEKEVEDEILKTMYYDIKPIAPEDAKLKLEEMRGSNFLTFINVDTGKVNVIFRLKDGKNFGLVEPAN